MKLREEERLRVSEEQEKLTKDQLKVVALKQRIGQLTSDYEERIADLRADFTVEHETYNELLNKMHVENEDLKQSLVEFKEAKDVQENSSKKSTE